MKTKLIQAISLLLSVTSLLFSQNTPFLSQDQINMLRNEISGDRAFEHIRVLTQWHRDSGMDGYFKAMDYVVAAAKEAGLSDVKMIAQPFEDNDGNPRNYTAKSAELWIVDPIELKLADIGDHALYLSDNSRDANVTAELVWVGNATEDEIKAANVKGKIAVAHANPGTVVRLAVYKYGAIGAIAYTTSESKSILDFPDQLPWTRIGNPPEGQNGSFAFSLSPRKGEMLKRMLLSTDEDDYFATGISSKGGKVKVKAIVDTDIGKENKHTGTGMVEGWIHGTKYKDQQIIVTAHLQEEQGSANDDGSGSANILELGRVFSKLIKEGKIKPPLRDIRFWWSDEISSEYEYIQANPGSEKMMLANIHQDMTGAKQSIGSRVQHLIYDPHSRTSYLDALFESIGNFIILTNNPFIQAGRQGGYPRPHSQPIYATRGSREGYNARFVPYFGSSDNLVFVEGAIGVPSVALINWDDYYIHSDDDDLDKIDQTQLQRNNFLIGAMGLFLAYAEAKDIPLIASQTYAQGSKRLANDVDKALEIINSDDNWKDAHILIEQGIIREKRAINSARVIAGKDKKANQILDKFVDRLTNKEKELITDLSTFYNEKYSRQPSLKLTSEELAASKKVPMTIESLREYFNKRTGVRGSGLHSLMRSETHNFVDGKRSYYDIYKGVKAEALAAGKFFYGTVTLDDVVKLLEANVESGALKLK
ncbi:MAG: hypothetical protein KDD94_00595 [Calditrichaeota bacterium]|nr:hypothetical protein [Calditrichota bacterium]